MFFDEIYLIDILIEKIVQVIENYGFCINSHLLYMAIFINYVCLVCHS